jgi:hypothetical protein
VRSASLSIKAALAVVLLALLCVAVPRPVQAQSAPASCPTSLPAGVTCSIVNGVPYYSGGGTSNTGTNCITNLSTGVQECIAPNDPGGGSTGGSSGLGSGLGSVNSSPQPSTGTGWLSRLTGWIAYAINAVFDAIATFLRDLIISIFSNVMQLVLLMINAIPVPPFLTNYSMSSILGGTGSMVGFFMSELNIGPSLALIGAGYVFRLLRKFLTLFQW